MKNKPSLIEIVEIYNAEGVCIKRTSNGYDLPLTGMKEVVFFGSFPEGGTRKFFIAPEQLNNFYKKELPPADDNF